MVAYSIMVRYKHKREHYDMLLTVNECNDLVILVGLTAASGIPTRLQRMFASTQRDRSEGA